MANKKVEEKNMKNKKNDIKKVPAKKKEKIVEAVVEEEMITCEECGKKYLASLNECPKCGYSPITSKKTFYDDEEEFEEYDDEDEEIEEVKEEVKPVKEEIKKTSKKEEKKEEKKPSKKDEKKSSKDLRNKKVSIDSKKSMLTDDSNDILSFIKIIVVIVLLVAVVWLIAAFVNKEFDNQETDKKEEPTATIQNEEILGTSIFTKADKEYYVLVYDGSEDNHWGKYYAMLYSDYAYIKDEKKVPMYWVDLSDPLNKDIVAEDAKDVNKKPTKYENLSIASPALIRIKNGKLDKYYDGDYAVDKITRLIESFQEKEEDKK